MGVRGTDFDGINVAGNLAFGNPTTLTLDFTTAGGVDWSDSFWDSNYTGTNGWLLYDVAGTLTDFDNLMLSMTDWMDGDGDLFSAAGRPNAEFGLFQSGNDVYVTYAVPEPTSFAMVGIGLLACGRRRRRRVARKSE